MLMMIIGLVLSSFCFFLVLWWWSEGMVETSDAVILITVFCGLTFGLFVAKSVWQFALAFISLAGATGYVIHSFKIGGMRSYYKKRCEEYIHVIESDPRNLAAREFLADSLREMGELDRSIDEIQAAVDMGAGIECQYKLNKWQKERYLRDSTNPVCRWCHTENALGAKVCSKCGSDLPYDNALSRWLVGGKTARARYYLLLVIGFAIVAVSYNILPAKLAFIPLLLCITALAGWWLINSARS